MSLKSKTFVSIFILFLLFIAGNTNLNAQSWAQCPSGEDIIRCETINCPKGDTNKDGSCSLDDENAQYSDARNNSLCANPTSGCGVIYYYPANSTQSCSVRVKERGTNCSLYKLTKFSPTPIPTLAPTPTPTTGGFSSTSKKSTPTPTPKVSARLPKTGSEQYIVYLLVLFGLIGIYLYSKLETK